MNGLVEGLVALSLKGAAVVALVGLVQLALGDRVPAALRHALWLLVFVRLLVPVVPASPLSLLSLAPDQPGRVLPGLDAALLGGGAAPPAAGSGPASFGETSPTGASIVAIWLLGFVAVAGRALLAELRLRRHLRRRPAIDDPRLARLLAEACRAAGVRPLAAVETPCVASPALHGLVRPRVLLPPGFAAAADDRALGHVLLHEATHLRRRDLPLRALAHLAAAIHWFNPAAWLALSRLDAECELACDAATLARLPLDDRREYGRTLLLAAAPTAWRERSVTVAALPLATRHHLRRRILMIARFRPVSRRRLAVLSLALAVLAPVALTEAPSDAPANASGEEYPEHKRTMLALRDVGTAAFRHLTEGRESPLSADREDRMRFDWNGCPRIGRAELAAILVPGRLSEIPATDGWGNPLEYCLADGKSLPAHFVGVRSPGRDGRYEGHVYVGGSFPPDEVDGDVVWMDGLFVRWPEKPSEE